MNSEILRPVPKALITRPETLVRICWNFANQITDQRWVYDDVRSTQFERSLSESIGVQTALGKSALKPIVSEINVKFGAEKTMVSEPEEKQVDVEQYRLEMTIGQSVDHTDMPGYLLDEIFDMHDAEDHDHGDSVMDYVEPDNIDEVDITKEQTISYDINGDGEIEYYSLKYAYLFEGETVHENYYASDEGERITIPIKLSGTGEVVDEKPAAYESLSDKSIEREIKNIDEAWQLFSHRSNIEEATAFGGQTQYEHRQQALAMLSLLSSGFVTLRQLASR